MLEKAKGYANDMWWLLLIAGVASLLFGIATLFMPGVTLLLQITLFAAFVVIWGIVELMGGLSDIKKSNWWWLSSLIGLLLLGLGVYLVKNPDITVATFVIVLGWALLARGIYDVVVGLAAYGEATMKIFRVVMGVLGVIAGIVVWVYPVTGTLAFTWVLGLYAVVIGVIMLSEALSTRPLLEEANRRRK